MNKPVLWVGANRSILWNEEREQMLEDPAQSVVVLNSWGNACPLFAVAPQTPDAHDLSMRLNDANEQLNAALAKVEKLESENRKLHEGHVAAAQAEIAARAVHDRNYTAPFILHACNSHDHLVTTIREIKRACVNYGKAPDGMTVDAIGDMCDSGLRLAGVTP